jgi:hypothetical protein
VCMALHGTTIFFPFLLTATRTRDMERHRKSGFCNMDGDSLALLLDQRFLDWLRYLGSKFYTLILIIRWFIYAVSDAREHVKLLDYNFPLIQL